MSSRNLDVRVWDFGQSIYRGVLVVHNGRGVFVLCAIAVVHSTLLAIPERKVENDVKIVTSSLVSRPRGLGEICDVGDCSSRRRLECSRPLPHANHQ